MSRNGVMGHHHQQPSNRLHPYRLRDWDFSHGKPCLVDFWWSLAAHSMPSLVIDKLPAAWFCCPISKEWLRLSSGTCYEAAASCTFLQFPKPCSSGVTLETKHFPSEVNLHCNILKDFPNHFHVCCRPPRATQRRFVSLSKP